MFSKAVCPLTIILTLLAACLAGCQPTKRETSLSPEPAISQAIATLPAVSSPPTTIAGQFISSPGIPAAFPTPSDDSITPTFIPNHPAPTPDLSDYAFPAVIDPARHYLFYLHGKIIEDQGLPAISPDYGEYEYKAILEKLRGYGLVVISEQRPKNTDSGAYARRITEQVKTLLNAGVPAKNITVVGASKGAGITILVSYVLENNDLNFVIMAICDPATVEELKKNQIFLYGNVLSIFDSADELAGSCQDLFVFSEGKGINQYEEIVLNVGTGHGILYKPMDEWIIPTVRWAGKP